MYAGRLVEVGPVATIFRGAAAPLHAAADQHAALPGRQGRCSRAFPGMTPSLLDPPSGLRVPPALPRRMRELLRSRVHALTRGAPGPLGRLPPVRRRCSMTPHSWKRATSPRSLPAAACIGKKRTSPWPLDDVSLTIHADQPSIIAIAGESGSGKTTLSRAAAWASSSPPRVRCSISGKPHDGDRTATSAWPSAARCRPSFRTRSRSITRSTRSITC